MYKMDTDHKSEIWQKLISFHSELRTLSAASNIPPSTISDLTLSFLQNTCSFEEILFFLGDPEIISNEQNFKILVETIKFLFDSETLKERILEGSFTEYFIQGMFHGEGEIRKLCVKKVKDVGIELFDEREKILECLVYSFCDTEPAVYVEALQAVLDFAFVDENNFKQALEKIMILSNALYCRMENNSAGNMKNKSKEVKEVFNKVKELDISEASTYFMRTVDCLLKLAIKDEKTTKMCIERNAFVALKEILTGHDILLQINIINSIPQLTATAAGFDYLLNAGFVKLIAGFSGLPISSSLQELNSTEANVTESPFLAEYGLRAFAIISARSLMSQISESHLQLAEAFVNTVNGRVSKLLRNKNNINSTEANNLLNAVGFFVSSSPWRAWELILKVSQATLISQSTFIDNWISLASIKDERIRITGLNSLADALRSGVFDYAFTEVLSSFAQVDDAGFTSKNTSSKISSQEAELELKKSSDLCRELLVLYSNKVMGQENSNILAVLLECLETPVNDLQCVSFKLLSRMVRQTGLWGLRSISANKAVADVLLNRNLYISKECKEWRFNVLEGIITHPQVKEVISETLRKAVKEFLTAGPFIGNANKDSVLVEAI